MQKAVFTTYFNDLDKNARLLQGLRLFSHFFFHRNSFIIYFPIATKALRRKASLSISLCFLRGLVSSWQLAIHPRLFN